MASPGTSARAALRRMSASTARASAIWGRPESSVRSARVRAAVSPSTSDFGRLGARGAASKEASAASGVASVSTERSLRTALRSPRLMRPRVMIGSPLRSMVTTAPACAISALSQLWCDARSASRRVSAASRAVHSASLSESDSTSLSSASISASRSAMASLSSCVSGRARGRTRSLVQPSICPWCNCASTHAHPSAARDSRISSMRSAARRCRRSPSSRKATPSSNRSRTTGPPAAS